MEMTQKLGLKIHRSLGLALAVLFPFMSHDSKSFLILRSDHISNVTDTIVMAYYVQERVYRKLVILGFHSECYTSSTILYGLLS